MCRWRANSRDEEQITSTLSKETGNLADSGFARADKLGVKADKWSMKADKSPLRADKSSMKASISF